jgi:exonuclease III
VEYVYLYLIIIKADTVNVERHCLDFDIELYAVKIQCGSFHIYVLSVYRAPSGNFINFMQKIDEVLKSLYKLKTKFIICGDFNTDYLPDKKKST